MTQTVQDAIRILREYTGHQIVGNLLDDGEGRCAMGVLGGSDLVRLDDGEECWRGKCNHVEFQIGAEFGLAGAEVEDILDWNDGQSKSSFAESRRNMRSLSVLSSTILICPTFLLEMPPVLSGRQSL